MTKKHWLCLTLVIVAVFAAVIVLRRSFPPKAYVPPEEGLLQELIQALEQKDAQTIKSLFSANTVSAVPELDAQITRLCDFYTGSVTETVDKGLYAQLSKEIGCRSEVIQASYDLTTTEGAYRIAFQFCTIDTENPGEEGLHSLYMIRAEDSDMDFSYWGGHQWMPGVVIE